MVLPSTEDWPLGTVWMSLATSSVIWFGFQWLFFLTIMGHIFVFLCMPGYFWLHAIFLFGCWIVCILTNILELSSVIRLRYLKIVGSFRMLLSSCHFGHKTKERFSLGLTVPCIWAVWVSTWSSPPRAPQIKGFPTVTIGNRNYSLPSVSSFDCPL